MQGICSLVTFVYEPLTGNESQDTMARVLILITMLQFFLASSLVSQVSPNKQTQARERRWAVNEDPPFYLSKHTHTYTHAHTHTKVFPLLSHPQKYTQRHTRTHKTESLSLEVEILLSIHYSLSVDTVLVLYFASSFFVSNNC